ncbi:MAG: hypothetical protein P4M00_10375 [Azospirillaceae bacterium]|nr:hypothetical protein [Azospirillaceae bacterium]
MGGPGELLDHGRRDCLLPRAFSNRAYGALIWMADTTGFRAMKGNAHEAFGP